MSVQRTLPLPSRLVAGLAALATAVAGFVWASPAVAAPRGGASEAASASGGTPHALTTDFLDAPMTVDPASAPTLRWQLPDGTSQSRFQIVVTESASGDAVWDSGEIESTSARATYAGTTLTQATRYSWTVRAWDTDGAASPWSKPAEFGTGPTTAWDDARTIWASGPEVWGGDFDLTFRAQFVEKHVTLAFRAANGDNFYLWQFRGDGVNELAVHKKVAGDSAPAVLKTAPLGVAIENGPSARFYDIRLVAEGNKISTYLDGRLVDTTVDATFASGGFGFYSGGTESYLVDDVVMKDLGGDVLYENDFTGTAYNDFGCGTLTGTALSIPRAQRAGCVYYGPWSDYDMEFDLSVTTAAVGVMLRAADARNNLMWQVRGDTSRIVPHTRVNGTFAALAAAPVSPAIGIGNLTRVKISARGNEFTTFINGSQVDKRTVVAPRVGGIGVRTGSQESGTISNLTVTTPRGEVIYRSDPSAHPNEFPCAPASNGVIAVPKAADCLRAGTVAATPDWAFLRTEFAVDDKAVASATLFATSSSTSPARQYVHRVLMNGEFVGVGPSFPVDDETRFDGWDVTSLVRQGEQNALGAIAYTTAGRQFLATLVVEYEDGTRTVVTSSPAWRSLPDAGAVYPAAGSVGTSYFSAPIENLQGPEYPFGFSEPGFDDEAWVTSTLRPSLTSLVGSTTGTVEEETHAPERIVEKAPGHYFIDFGRSWVGGVRLDLDGPAGSMVEVRYGEELTDRTTTANTVRWQLRTGNTYRDRYTLAGGGESLQNWGFRVFRYVEIIGAPEAITADTIAATALVYPMGDDATFAAAGSDLEQVWELSRHTIDSQNLNAYADSWTRERAPYEADAFIQLQSHIYLDDDPTLAEYSMDYLLSRRTWPTEWPMYLILGAHELWQSTGSAAFIEDNYDQLVSRLPSAYLESSTGLIRKTSGSNGCNSVTDCDIVDWPASERDGYVFRQYNTVVNALAYRSYRDMADMAEATGREADAAEFTAIADRLREAINTYLYDAEAGAYDDGMDAARTRTGHHAIHASVFAQAFGVTPPEERERVGGYLAQRGMQCSVYCAPFLLQALYDGNQGDAAYDLLTSDGQRSWLNMIALGAGATMEAWDPALKSNTTFSHPWASSPAFVIPRGMFGIRSTEAGYAQFSVKIQPGALDTAQVSVPTVKGLIRAAFDRGDGEMSVGLHVPAGSAAQVAVPVNDPDVDTLYVDRVAVPAAYADGYAVIEQVGPGCHLVSATADADAGAASASCPDGFDVDAEAPTVTIDVDGDVTDGWVGPDAVVTIGADDAGSGVAAVDVRIDGGEWAPYSERVALAEGMQRVEARATDAAGNVSRVASRELGLDSSSPATTAATQRGDAAASGLRPVTVTLSATDAGSGVAATSYRVDDGDTVAYDGPFTVAGAGVHTVTYWSTDAVGNREEERQASVMVDASATAPAVGTLTSNEGWDTGLSDGTFTVTMSLWWGENATEYDLYRDGELVATVPLTWSGRATQTGAHRVEGLPNGTYEFSAVLRNASGTSATAPLVVTVANASPGTPVLAHDNYDRDGNYSVTAHLWWGTNATSYRFLENGSVVDEGTLEAASPSAQHATFTAAQRTPGTYRYVVEFTNHAGTTTSAPLTVAVR
ncbi:family 78 glycoside hydrolase catalytic domain [Demequina sp. NBRC 110057]|uniref:family 78 glycoside hydrolase catalytic domain n=1 Tax=Demequina sp. NBRC 110057 TaxID=1570346 RepID=UPI0011773D20|nr:family 78 glycoside hydrolase catalytic domain [Demequina sp. NBRC 110057]